MQINQWIINPLAIMSEYFISVNDNYCPASFTKFGNEVVKFLHHLLDLESNDFGEIETRVE